MLIVVHIIYFIFVEKLRGWERYNYCYFSASTIMYITFLASVLVFNEGSNMQLMISTSQNVRKLAALIGR
jgi:hypothetical protein